MANYTFSHPDYRLILDDLSHLRWSWPKATFIYSYVKLLLPVAFASLLVALVLRIVFGLFLIESQFALDIRTLTEPFVYPFQGLFLNENEMLQAPAFAAFSFYYTGYFFLGKFFRWYRKPRVNQPNLSI